MLIWAVVGKFLTFPLFPTDLCLKSGLGLLTKADERVHVVCVALNVPGWPTTNSPVWLYASQAFVGV